LTKSVGIAAKTAGKVATDEHTFDLNALLKADVEPFRKLRFSPIPSSTLGHCGAA